MSKFLSSLGVAKSELALLASVPVDAIVRTQSETGSFEQGSWRLPSGESISFEMVSWEAEPPGPPGFWEMPPDDVAAAAAAAAAASEDSSTSSRLDQLPLTCLARVAAGLSLRDLAAASAACAAFARLVRSDVCWLERLRRHFGAGHLRGCCRHAAADACCGNPLARVFLQALLGLYRARPVAATGGEAAASAAVASINRRPSVDSAQLAGALFPAPLLSPVCLGQPLAMQFRFAAVHSGRYELLLRAKKLLCEPLDSDVVATAVDSSGVRVPLLQARINRRNVTISNFECSVEIRTTDPPGDADNGAAGASATASPSPSQQQQELMRSDTVSHLLQNYNMPADRWFHWRLAVVALPAGPPRDLLAGVSVMRRGVADAAVTQEEFERELRNALLVDHLYLKLLPFEEEPPSNVVAVAAAEG